MATQEEQRPLQGSVVSSHKSGNRGTSNSPRSVRYADDSFHLQHSRGFQDSTRSSAYRDDDQDSHISSDDMPAFSTTSELMYHRPVSRDVEASQYDATQTDFPQFPPGLYSSVDDIDNKTHAENVMTTPGPERSVAGVYREVSGEDLAASKLFSHEDAESMYMSAVGVEQAEPQSVFSVSPSASRSSLAPDMPGGWGSSEHDSAVPALFSAPEANPQESRGLNTKSQAGNYDRSDPTTDASRLQIRVNEQMRDQGSSEAAARALKNSPTIPSPRYAAQQILRVGRAAMWFSIGILANADVIVPEADRPQSSHSASRHRHVRSIGDSSFLQDASLSASAFGKSPPDDPTFSRLDYEPEKHGSIIDIEMGAVNLQTDLDTAKLIGQVAKDLPASDSETQNRDREVNRQGDFGLSTSLRISSLTISLTEALPEKIVTIADLLISDSTIAEMTRRREDVLICVSMTSLRYRLTKTAFRTTHLLNINKLTVSDADNAIIVFDDSLRAQESIRDLRSADVNDVFVTVVLTSSDAQLSIRTKPLHLFVNLLQIDDVLSRSGGLSSLLELGNSVASTTKVRESPTARKSQGIRFADTVRQPAELAQQQPRRARLEIRIAGAFVEFTGSTTSMTLWTSPLKMIYRPEGFGLQIDAATVKGPFRSDESQDPDDSDIEASLDLTIKNARIEYLNVPKDIDLERLVSIITPSKNTYEEDDDIMVDTLLRQRRKGGVIRMTLGEIILKIANLDFLSDFEVLAGEAAKLSTVARYLPEDDRPGILTLALVKKVDCFLHVGGVLGSFKLDAELLEAAHVNVPSLMACQITSITLNRNDVERLIGEAVNLSEARTATAPPMLMCRFIADEMEPTVKLKLYNTSLDYHVSTVVDALTFLEKRNEGLDMAESKSKAASPSSSAATDRTDTAEAFARKAQISIVFRDSAFGLNPRNLKSKGLIVLTDVSFTSAKEKRKELTAVLEVKKASIMIIDDTSRIINGFSLPGQAMYFDESTQVQTLSGQGYVSVGYISAASAVVKLTHAGPNKDDLVDVELRNNLFILETCADSFQTLTTLLGSLSPPSAPSAEIKFRTEVVPLDDMLASFTGDAFVSEKGPEQGLRAGHEDEDGRGEDEELEYVSGIFGRVVTDADEEAGDVEPDEEEQASSLAESYVDSEMTESAISDVPVTARMTASVAESIDDETVAQSMLDFREDHFMRNAPVGGTAHRWNAKQNSYGLAHERKIEGSPLRVRVRDVHIIWNLFDGYDWPATRDTISNAVREIEVKAASRRSKALRAHSPGVQDEEEEAVIGDFLFNSIYIGIPANKDARDLAAQINQDIDDAVSETGSYATRTTLTATTSRRRSGSRPRQKRLKLGRSKHHKMTFELGGISMDYLVFPRTSSEVQSSIDIRVKNIDVFDHVPTSTWKKFATYMHDAGEREAETNMLHVELLNVKPIQDLSTTEMVLKITILPLRLHVDQDALDFMARFFEFKDESAPTSIASSSPPFLQRVEVNPVKLRLDFKPKRVDYAGLRSGRTTEFMNFLILESADMTLRRIILYGVTGFDRLGLMLNSIWSPDVRKNQLPGILGSLAAVKPVVGIMGGVRELVVVPMREYKKDGRVVRSIQKGAVAFAKTTTKELVSLGAKLAIGTQTVLQGAEALVSPDADKPIMNDDEEEKQISLYADQPIGITQGLRGAYASLERDLLLARDAIVAVPGEVMASRSAKGAAAAIARQAPTIILRPAIGASKAVGQTLLGAANTLDKANLRRAREVRTLLSQLTVYTDIACRNTRIIECVLATVSV